MRFFYKALGYKYWILAGKMLLVVLFVFSFAGSVNSQTSWVLPVNGKITKSGKKLEGATVSLLKGGSQIKSVTTSGGGKFEFELEGNADYTISVTKPGFVTKKINFSTKNVPEERALEGFGGVDIGEIGIFEIPKNIDPSELNGILNQPIAKFEYNPSEKDFNYDPNYTESIRSQLNKVAVAQKQAEEEEKKILAEKAAAEAAVKAAADAKAKAELEAKKKAEADAKLKAEAEAKAKADADAKAKAELEAKKKIEEETRKKAEADAKLKAEADAKAKAELEAKKKLEEEARKKAEADAKLKVEADAKAKAELEMKKKLEEEARKKAEADAKLKAEADAKAKAELEMKKKLEEEARKKAEADAKLKAELEAKKKLEEEARKKAEADAKLKAESDAKAKAEMEAKRKVDELNQKYTAAVSRGDKQLASKDFRNAKLSYQEALTLKSTESYPREKIKECDKYLNAVVANAPVTPPPPTTTTNNKSDEERRKEFMNEMVKKYPQGVTEEQQDESNCKIIKRIVVKGNEAWVYKKKIWNWGGVFYFKDDVSISEYTFEAETK